MIIFFCAVEENSLHVGFLRFKKEAQIMWLNWRFVSCDGLAASVFTVCTVGLDFSMSRISATDRSLNLNPEQLLIHSFSSITERRSLEVSRCWSTSDIQRPKALEGHVILIKVVAAKTQDRTRGANMLTAWFSLAVKSTGHLYMSGVCCCVSK